MSTVSRDTLEAVVEAAEQRKVEIKAAIQVVLDNVRLPGDDAETDKEQFVREHFRALLRPLGLEYEIWHVPAQTGFFAEALATDGKFPVHYKAAFAKWQRPDAADARKLEYSEYRYLLENA